ncbi:MAG: hypothetical protein ACOX9R_04575 [Armatimonadota bacterium]|jgi:hypothetical protein
MIRLIATTAVLIALLSGTALVAGAAGVDEWVAIGDGYVPKATVAPTAAAAPDPVPASADCPHRACAPGGNAGWIVAGDGYVPVGDEHSCC